MTAGPEQILHANGVDLCVQAFGDPADPAILLIAGAAASMLHFPEELCERLAAGDRYVIRYDHRDTGRSVTYAKGEPPYSGCDLAADALGVLDQLGIERAHLAGVSMGGGVAQYLAIHYPDRVASLTLISTSPEGPTAADRDLPRMSAEVAAEFAALSEPDWSERDAAVEYVFAIERLCASRSRAPDDDFIRRLAERTVDRADQIGAMTNHFEIATGTAGPRGALAGVTAPTLVVHGDEDPLFPLSHGQALADEIPGARLLVLEGNGHELPPRVWDALVPAIVDQTAG